METRQCFDLNCKNEVEFTCDCSSPDTYSCKLHLAEHLESSNLIHHFKPLFLKPHNKTKEKLLKFLTKEKSIQDKLRKDLVNSFTQNLQNSKNNLEEQLFKLDTNLFEIHDSFEKIFQAQKISKFEKDPILKLLTLHPDEAIEKYKEIALINFNATLLFPEKNPGEIVECFIQEKLNNFLDGLYKILNIVGEHYRSIEPKQDIIEEYFGEINQSISDLMMKIEASKLEFKDLKEKLWKESPKKTQNFSEDSISPTQLLIQKFKDKKNEMRINNPEFELDFRINCSSYDLYLKENKNSDPLLIQAYQDYITSYHQISSIYLTRGGTASKTNLIIYDTESERKEIKMFTTPETLNYGTCIAQIPNNELFCFGKINPISGISLIIDKNCEIQVLPSGTPCSVSSAIYFDRNIYCFGGFANSALTLSERFDLDKNQWIKLNPLPQADWLCHSILYKGNILISGSQNRNILVYSIENNGFTRIPFNFAPGKRKILVNVEKLYLIECDNGMIYESEFGDENVWTQVSKSIIAEMYPHQVYCSYNKGAIYIGVNLSKIHEYYKFDLGQKSMIGI